MKKFIKKTRMVLIFLGILGFFFLGNANLSRTQAAGEVWTFVDGNLGSGLNKDAVRHAADPVMEVFNNELYVAWTENNSSAAQIRVRKYDGSTWSWVDGGGAAGINYNTAENARTPFLIVFNGNLYAIWSETYSGNYVTRVKRYDGGSTWTSIDGSATNGLNKDSVTSGLTSGPTFGVCNGTLYATWVETYSGAGGAYQLHVKRYDGDTAWTFVDGGAFTSLNYDTNRTANKPKLCSINNTLYLIWTEINPSSKYIVRIKRYDGGSTWTTVDGGSGLNYNSGNTVDEARLVVYNNSLYAYWLENYFVRVKSYNGSAWSTADSNAGFKQNNLNYAYAESPPAAIPYGNKLYFTWGEDISYDPWSIQTRACYYYSGAMTFIDGNDWTTGLNFNRLQYAYKPSTIEYNGVLYLAWYESNGSANQLRVRSTPLPAVVNSVTVPADGRYIAGQNLDFTVTFNKAVNVIGTPIIPITLTSGVVNALYCSGSGTATLTFRCTVATGNEDADGIAVGTSISLNGGSIRDSVYSLDADINLNSVASTSGVLVDTSEPTLVSATGTDNTHLTVTLSENCTNITKANNGGFTVSEIGNTSKTYAVSAIAQGTDASHVVLTVANMGVSGAKGVKIKYTAGTNGTIRDIAGHAMATNNTGVSAAAWDTTAPTLVSVIRTDNTHLNVALSEKCTNLINANNGGFTVKETGNPSKTYAVSVTTAGTDAAHIVLTVANLKVSGKEGVTVKYTIGGNGIIHDIAGNEMATDSTGVSVDPWDTTAPSITSATLASSNSYIDIVFSEGLFGAVTGSTGLTAADFSLIFVANGGTASNATISSVKKNDNTVEASASALTGNETTVRVFLSITGKPSGVETIEIAPATSASIYDKAGNATSASVTTGPKLLNDKMLPTLVLATRTNNTRIEVTLSEDCTNITKTGTGGFTVSQIGNPAITYAVTSIAQGSDASHVVLTVANLAVSGKEGVKVKYTAGTNGTIQDNAGNAMATSSTGVTVLAWDTTVPALINVERTNNTHLTVSFSENCVNLVNANNGGFTVGETGSSITYAVTATTQGVDASHIILTVANMGASAKEGITVKYTAGGNGIIQDIAGNTMATDSIGVPVTAWDTTAPTITLSMLASNNNYIDITFSEGVYGANNGTTGLTAADFVLWFTSGEGNATNATISSVKKNDNTIEGSASALTGGETTVRVFLSITGIPNGNEIIEIQSASGVSIFDKAGNAVSALETTGSKQLNDKLPPELVYAEWIDNTHITVRLTEDVTNVTKANNGGFTVNEVGNAAVTYAVSSTTQGVDAQHVILTVANMAASSAKGVKIKYTAGTNGTIRDVAGNALATSVTGATVAAW
jgi:hypothetical protein